MDTGGYTMQNKFSKQPMTPENQDEWRELNARWFQYSTFTPLLRVHGELRPREMWTLGDDTPAFNAELSFDRLRYALFPYIYSQAGWITQSGYTMMRPLVMDFSADRIARELPDEYMFGPALLLAPITEYKQRSRSVYLPASAQWYDYWTGHTAASGRISSAAPLDRIPVFVRAGSIIPYAPPMQYIGEKASDPTTIYVYAGASGSFLLYEDQGTTFDYEHGAFTQIPIHWDDKSTTLTLGRRTGNFDGMLDQRTFQIVLVTAAHPAAYSSTPTVTRTAHYTGDLLRLSLH
jgi:alpha-D-xyloside xylohydrolase